MALESECCIHGYICGCPRCGLPSQIDPRPPCIRCGQRWIPAEGIDATMRACDACLLLTRARRLADELWLAETNGPPPEYAEKVHGDLLARGEPQGERRGPDNGEAGNKNDDKATPGAPRP